MTRCSSQHGVPYCASISVLWALLAFPMFSSTATHAVPREGFLAFARQRYSRDWSRTLKLSAQHTRNHTPSCLRSRDHRNTELRCRLAWVDAGGLRTAGTWGTANIINVNRNAGVGETNDVNRNACTHVIRGKQSSFVKRKRRPIHRACRDS